MTPRRPEVGSTVQWRMGHNGQLRSGVVQATAERDGRVTVLLDREVSPLSSERWISTDCLLGFNEPDPREAMAESYEPRFKGQYSKWHFNIRKTI